MPGSDTARSSWKTDLRHRLGRLRVVKATCTPLGIALFFFAYFAIMKHPLFPATMMPLTALDRVVPFQPATLPIYFSLWVYVSLAPALLASKHELWTYGVATATLSVVGLTIFVFWPTAVPPADIDWALYPSIAFLKNTDLALNACPSMHVAFAVFTAMWIARVLGEMHAATVVRSVNVLWCAAIIWSTVSTRQHVVLDVAAGALLGWLVAAIHLRAVPGINPRLPTRASSSGADGRYR